MAETIKIEIPVSVQDKTDPALANITKKVNTLAKASEKVSKIMMGSGAKKSGIEKALEKQEKTLQKEHRIEITAQDNATPVLSEVEDRAARAASSVEIGIGAEDNASGVMDSASDHLAAFDGESGIASVGVENNATEEIGNAQDQLASFDGDSGVASLDAENNAVEEIGNASDALAAYDGESAEADLGAEDNATPVIHEVEDAAAALDGTHVQVTVDAVNNAADALANGGLNAAQSGIGNARRGIMAAAGFTGLSLGIGSAINSFKDFEAGMSEVKAISGATEEQFASLTEKAKYMGATTKFTATEASEGLKYMAMAGWKPDQMEAGLEGIMNLAAASGESLGATSDIVTDALTAFGKDADYANTFADILAEASADSNTNVGIMGESFKYAAPLMGAMGYSAYDTATALGLMANAGIKGSMAGTTLRTAISNLAAPTKQMREGMEKYGISLTDETGKMKTLKGVMDNVRKSLSGLSEDEQAAAVKTIFGKQAMSGMLAIINTEADAYDELYESIQNSEGAAGRMKDIMMDNLQGDLTLMSSAWEGVQDTFGERAAPHIRSLVQAVTDAMPGLSGAINDAFDDIDPMINNFKTKVGNMLSSEEWKNADGTDKINIAWDTLIADPFMEWVGGDGALLISEGVGSLFSEAFKILPGGEEAGLTSWLSAGVLAIAGTKIAGLAGKINGLSAAASGLGEAGTLFGTFAGAVGTAIPWIAGATAVLFALNTAIDAYNQKQIETDLEAHFGSINLSTEDIQTLSEEILELHWKANIDLALGELKNADKLRSDAKKKLEENKVIAYKAKVGVTLSQADTETYASNVNAFINARKAELDGRTFGAKLLVDTTLSTAEGETLSAAIDSWTLADNIEMSALSAQLSDAVTEALKDGVLDANEEEAITALQSKIDSIVNRWKVAEKKAARDMLVDKYGNLSGEELAAGSYKNLVEEMAQQRIASAQELDQSKEEFYTILHALDDAGRLKEVGLNIDTLKDQYRQAIQYEKDREIANDLTFQSNTLNNAWSGENEVWKAGSEERSTDAINYLTYSSNSAGAADMMVNQKANKGLNSMFDTYMSDQVDDMYATLQSYMTEFGGKVPEELRTAYMNAVNTGAFAGSHNEFVGAQSLANSFAEATNQSLVEAIEKGDYGQEVAEAYASGSKFAMQDALMSLFANDLIDDETAQQIGQQQMIKAIQDGEYGEVLQNALAIALAEGTDEIPTISGMQAEISELEMTQESASNIRKSVQDFMDATSEAGAEVEYDAGNVTVKLGEGTDTSGIQNALAMTEEELSGYQIEVEGGGIEYHIPEDQILSAQERAAQEIAAESGGEFKIDGGEAYVEWHIDEGQTLSGISEATGVAMERIAEMNGITDINVIQAGATIKVPSDQIDIDTSAIGEALQKVAAENAPSDIEQTANANTKVENGDTDTSAVKEGVKEDLDNMDDWETGGKTVVELSQTNNVDDIYSQVDGEVKGKFAEGFSANAPVSIHLDYSIENPSANISLGGSASGSGTVTATVSANGRYVDSPLLSWVGEDGPEFIIPVGSKRKDRGIELWEQAGQALGIPGYADGGLVGGSIPLSSSGDYESEGKEVNFAEGITPEVSGGNNGGVTVQVSLSPDFILNDADESNILAMIRANMKELADDLGGELAEKLSEAYENRPVA